MYESVAVYPSAARTANPTPVIVQVPTEAMYVDIDIETTASSTPSTTVNVDFILPSGAFQSALVSAAIAANGVVTLRLGPDVATTANLSAPLVLPSAIRVRPVHGNGNSHTYAVNARFRG